MFEQLKQVKQAMQMRKEAQRIQAEVEKITKTYENGGISCTARGDMSIVSIEVSDEALKEVLAGRKDRFHTMLATVVNGALKNVKKATQDMMMQMMQSGEGGGLFGGLK